MAARRAQATWIAEAAEAGVGLDEMGHSGSDGDWPRSTASI